MAARSVVLMPATTLAAARTGIVASGGVYSLPARIHQVSAQAVFLYGASGTDAMAWVQTSLDNGSTWFDIINFRFALTAATLIASVKNFVAATAITNTPLDAALADNTILDGIIGDRLRVKWSSTGTYTGSTSLAVTVVVS